MRLMSYCPNCNAQTEMGTVQGFVRAGQIIYQCQECHSIYDRTYTKPPPKHDGEGNGWRVVNE